MCTNMKRSVGAGGGGGGGGVMRLVTAIHHGSFSQVDLEKPVFTQNLYQVLPSHPAPPKPLRRKHKARHVEPEDEYERARVLFSYVAENDDELSISEGEIINILEKELEDSGWWKGELNGKVGVFPDNFVDILPPEEQKPKKPPPPSLSKPETERPLPKLAPVSETKVKPEEKKSAPALPTKKPAMPPPPISKKPLGPKHASDLITQTDDHKVKESQKELVTSTTNKLPLNVPTPVGRPGRVPEPRPSLPHVPISTNQMAVQSDPAKLPSTQPTNQEIDLDIVPSAEPLTHPNANRARAPQRRLPTMHNKELDDVDHHKEEPPPSGPAPPIPEFPESPRLRDAYARRSHRRAQQKAELRSGGSDLTDAINNINMEEPVEPLRPRPGSRPAPPLPKNEPPHSPSPARAATPREDSVPDSAAQNEETARIIAELRRELDYVKNNTVPKPAYQALEKEVTQLREMTSKLEKLTTVLMNDIDEGTKERKSMQVEIDRIRKLTMMTGGSS